MSDPQPVTLSHPGGTLDLPVVPATEGGVGLDISVAAQGHRVRRARPGLRQHRVLHVGDHLHRRRRRASCATAATRSSSWPSSSTFLEVTYLLIYGELPTATQLEDFDQPVRRHTLLHEDLKRFFDGFPRDAHPMPVLSSAVSALSTFYQDSLNPFDAEQVEISTDPAAGQAADDRRLRVQEVGRAAVPLPGQLPRAWSRTSCG